MIPVGCGWGGWNLITFPLVPHSDEDQIGPGKEGEMYAIVHFGNRRIQHDLSRSRDKPSTPNPTHLHPTQFSKQTFADDRSQLER